jgi:hypothetical protein
MRTFGSIIGFVTLAVTASGAGCSADSNGSSSGSGANGGHAANGGGSAKDGGGINLGGGGSNGGASASSDAGGGGGFVDPNSACATNSETASLVPVDMFVMFDRSGSMANDNKWVNASTAMTYFFEDSASAGLNVALRFFPDDKPMPGCSKSGCSVHACSQPLVAPGMLLASPKPADTQEDALVNAILGNTDLGGNGGGTPLYAALAGAEQWATDYKSSNPGDKLLVVLVTDGLPNGCDENINHIAGLAGDALASSDILTYAIGMVGSAQSDMDAIAQAGGTQQGIFISNSNTQTELEKAFKAIQGSAISCSFPVPQPPAGQTLDPNQINVNLTTGNPPSTVTLGRTNGITDCGPAGGWYYDDPASPSSIVLCPVSCSAAQSDAASKIDIVVGCDTNMGSGGANGAGGGSGVGGGNGNGGNGNGGNGNGGNGGNCSGSGQKCATSSDCCSGFTCTPDGLGGLVCSFEVY